MVINYKSKTIEPAVNVLAFHGKSFRFASRFLSKKHLNDCARLYRFCRFVDDLVDEESDILLAQNKLDQLKQNLELGYSQIPVVQDFIELAKYYQMQPSVVSELIKGIESDLTPAQINNEAELLRYCYRVAGTVGLLMCDVLGVKDLKARPHAIDLGIAMQLTNIARDVMEDAEKGRRYIPGKWVGRILPDRLPRASAAETEILKKSVKRLLSLANLYYESGAAGLGFLPPRARKGIQVAAIIYKEIGVVIEEKGYDVLSGRAYVNLVRKLHVAFRALMSNTSRRPYPSHNASLHIYLKGLPHANNSAQ